MGSISVAMPVAVAPMSGIRTAATAVSGGVTTCDKAPKKPKGGVRRTSDPEHPEITPCPHCVDNGEESCVICGHDIYECECETCSCNVPLDFNWGAMVFMAVMAAAYAVWKRRTA